MKATIEIEFTIDGKKPGRHALVEAVWKLVSEAGYLGSEEIDGTDEWGLEIENTTVSVSDNEPLTGQADKGCSVQGIVDPYQPLFDYLHDELGALALQTQMQEIIEICLQVNAEAGRTEGRGSAKGIVETKETP